MLTQKLKTERLNASPFITLYLPSTPKQAVSYFALPGMKGKVNVPIVLNSKYQVDNIIKTCSNYFRIPFESLQSNTRMRNVVVARHITMWYLLTNTKMTLSEVGRIFGNRDHTTVIHAKKSVNDSLTSKFDNEYKVHIENLNVIL
jgi:chromosomal replication initiation ATPase DnaA